MITTNFRTTNPVTAMPVLRAVSGTSGLGTWRERVGSVDATRLHTTDHNSMAAKAGLSGYAVTAAKQAIAGTPAAAPPRGEPR